MRLRFYGIVIFLLVSGMGFGQKFEVPDSLNNLSYDQLYDKIYYHLERKQNETSKVYVNTYFNRAKLNNDSSKIARAFSLKSALYNYTDKRRIIFLDSALLYVNEGQNKKYPEAIYTWKGIAYERKGNFGDALSNYLLGLKYSKKSKNIFYIYVLKHNIGLIKRKLGKYDEAISHFKECIAYEESIPSKDKWDTISYLSSVSELISCYRLNNQLDSAKIFNKKALHLSKNKGINYLFELNKGIFLYKEAKYNEAKLIIENTIPHFFTLENQMHFEKYNLVSAYLYLGKTYKKLGNKLNANKYFKKIDSISNATNYIIPENRSAYVELVDHYKSENDFSNQLFYINKLVHTDSILSNNYKLVGNKLLREYDTPQLLAEKRKLISSLEKENTKISTQNIIIAVLLGISLFGIGYYYSRQRLYKQRFLKLLEEKNNNQKKDDSNPNPTGGTSINKETVNKLLDKLQQFEEQQGFLKQGLNSKDLAKSFGSNSSYLSKVVNTFKEKSFSNYINDLRIDFVVDRLQEDSRFRKYTIKAIAQDIGFNNSEAFAKAFYKKTGIYPSYFIKELEKR
ncbi:helix-turn-helix domain-containing protein [Aquimarina celericrescens]|uniref:Helix-turn-helix domain-containing protein n=1 Tax=Aquimarina celericrescens TaxID=1964542 RepID=A0ABW5AXN1_9FLAO|nr:AraC family transcriptional regulator [Aquimarina celericrescens]